MDIDRIERALEAYRMGKISAPVAVNIVEDSLSASNSGKPIVSRPLPPDYVVEKWWAGENVGSAKFWHEAPYRTNGDVIEDIKAALRHFMGGNVG